MRILYGHYERTIDRKNRVQIPAQLRARINPEQDGQGFYVTLGEKPHTLSIYPERYFERMAERIETEFMPGQDSQKFELQFYALASHVDMDAQGRILLPDNLRRKARLGENAVMVGQKHRIDIFNKEDFERVLDIDWDGDEWPDWQGFTRMRPSGPVNGNGGSAEPERRQQ